jgi:hypothetical protein
MDDKYYFIMPHVNSFWIKRLLHSETVSQGGKVAII